VRRRLGETQERLDDLVRLASDWLWETDATMSFTFVSPRVAEVLGFIPHELVGHHFGEFGAFLPAADEATSPLDPARRVPFRDVPFRFRCKDGTWRLCRVSSLPRFDTATGRFIGFRGTARDVTAETEASDRAAESQRQLLEAIESISEGFALFDAEDRLLLCNSKYREMFPRTAIAPGLRYEEILRAALASGDTVMPEREHDDWVHRRVAQRIQQSGHAVAQLGDGRWVRASDRRTADGSIVGIRSDITELKRREEALIAAKEAAEIASRSKSEFLANVSHELRTPLNAIIGFTEIMRNEIFGPIGSPQYRSYLGDVLDSARHLLEVINDLLDVAKAEAGRLVLNEAPCDPGQVARAAARLVQERASRGSITVAIEVPDDLPPLRADARKLKQVLLNLLTNAVKFTPPGGLVKVGAARAEDGDLLVTVTDTGIGIAPEDIPIALMPFGQVDSTLSRKYEGTGLGLPLSRALVELHRGTLSIESTVGVGTTVTVRLPAERVG
jgi:two-component system cell cycle sensor histidine kinase PleC